jgi:GGDEF domain-containing protein
MAFENTLVYLGHDGDTLPDLVQRFCSVRGLRLLPVESAQTVISLVNRSYPACIVLDARNQGDAVVELCSRLKSDAFTGIVPVVMLAAPDAKELAAEGLEAGADEVLSEPGPERENWLRFELALRRASRDVSVHPTTRLPGTFQIEREIGERIHTGEEFAVCYADLDSFKEFNDRYGYNNGDRVILLVSRILRDLVRALAPGGFVGHIGGDDFIFIIHPRFIETCCDQIIQVFDELIPFQYEEDDRRAGYFMGKDRRGTLYRVPLMTLSIGIVTNQLHAFSHTAEASELAAEMKGYAKTLPGSVFVVDRRQLSPRDRVVSATAPSEGES